MVLEQGPDRYEMTEGAKHFSAFLKEHGLTLKAASDALGVSDVAVLDWKRGKRRPAKNARDRIAVWTAGRVLPDQWDTADERTALNHIAPIPAKTGTDGAA